MYVLVREAYNGSGIASGKVHIIKENEDNTICQLFHDSDVCFVRTIDLSSSDINLCEECYSDIGSVL